MKTLILAVLLAVMQAAPPRPLKASDNPTDTSSHVKNDTGAKQQPTTQSQSLVNEHEPLATKGIAGQQGSDDAEHTVGISKLPPVLITRDWADWGYWAFGGLLVVVGFFQAFLVRFQARIMTQQTKLSDDTLGAIKRQADIMERQTKATEDSVQSLREIERPWIEVTIETPSLGPLQADLVAIVFKNHGRTVAAVKDVTISKVHDIAIQGMIDKVLSEPAKSDLEGLDVETLLPPGGDFKRLLNLAPWKTPPLTYNAIPTFVWVWGTVHYTDCVTPYTTIKNPEHVTNFCYACQLPVVHSIEEASRIVGDDDLRSLLLRGFQKTGGYPLNKYS